MRFVRCIAWVLAGCGAVAIGWAQDELPVWPQRELKFKVVDEPTERVLAFGSGDVHFEACFTTVVGGGFGYPACEDLLKTEAAKSFSAEQREFLEANAKVGNATPYGVRPTPLAPEGASRRAWPHPKMKVTYTVYGVTEADARLMAQAVIEDTDQRHRMDYESTKERVASIDQRLRDAPERLAKVEEELKRLQGAMEEAKGVFPYGSGDEAAQDVRELDKVLRNIDVEITGIRARTGAITRFKSDPRAAEEATRALLERLQIEEDINLGGALARRAAVEAQRENAQAYHDASAAHDKADTQRKAFKRDLAELPRQLELERAKLKEPAEEVRPLDVVDDTIVVRPIKSN